MPTIDELIVRHKKEIENERAQDVEAAAFEIPRDPQKRPWNGLPHSKKHPPIIEDFNAPPIVEPSGEDKVSALPWYASFQNLGRLLLIQKKVFLALFLLFACGFGYYASQIPVTYNSTLHLYAPEKWDSIGSRLPALTGRIEFTSFPTEFKIPLSLLSRRLRSEEARQWVISSFATHPEAINSGLKLNPDSVSVETVYAATTELLLVQGYANEPQTASLVTNLYWQYLEREIKLVRSEQMQKILAWIDHNLEVYDAQIAIMTEQLESLSSHTTKDAKIVKMQGKFSDTFADLELERINLTKELAQLNAAQINHSAKDLIGMSNPEFQEIGNIQIELAKRLQDLPESDSNVERQVLKAELEKQQQEVRELIQARAARVEKRLEQVTQDIKRIQTQLGQIQGEEGQIRMASEEEKDLRRQLFDFQSQKKVLSSLRSQLNLDSDLGQSILKAIQLPFADEKSIQPKPMVKYGLAVIVALVLSFFAIILLQFLKPIKL